jgi:signal transduction histidine kinase
MSDVRDPQLAATIDEYGRLLTFAAHELRTPVSVVGGYLRMLQLASDADFASRGRLLVDEAAKSCARLSELLAQLSDIGKMDISVEPIRAERFDWFSELPALAGTIQEGKDRGIELVVSGEASGAEVIGDRTRVMTSIGAVLRALLREQPLPVAVRADRRFVRSNGSHMAMLVIAQHDQLERALKAEKRPFDERRGGTGLTLPLARRAIEQAGGRLWSPEREESDLALRSAAVLVLPVAD